MKRYENPIHFYKNFQKVIASLLCGIFALTVSSCGDNNRVPVKAYRYPISFGDDVVISDFILTLPVEIFSQPVNLIGSTNQDPVIQLAGNIFKKVAEDDYESIIDYFHGQRKGTREEKANFYKRHFDKEKNFFSSATITEESGWERRFIFSCRVRIIKRGLSGLLRVQMENTCFNGGMSHCLMALSQCLIGKIRRWI